MTKRWIRPSSWLVQLQNQLWLFGIEAVITEYTKDYEEINRTENVVYIYKVKYYVALKRKEILTCHNKGKPWGYYANWNNPVTKDKYCIWVHFCEGSEVVKFIETDRMSVARGWGEWGLGNYCLLSTKVQFCKMKSSIDGWWWQLKNNVKVLTPLNCTLQNG